MSTGEAKDEEYDVAMETGGHLGLCFFFQISTILGNKFLYDPLIAVH